MEPEQATANPTAGGQPNQQAVLEAGVFCPECTYDLRGSVSARCPECGYALADIHSPVCRIPWSARRERGRFRTYWQTVGMVLFRHRRFFAEVARPVSFADAQAFRWVTVLHAYVPVLLVTLAAYLVYPPETVASPDAANELRRALYDGEVPAFIERAYAEAWPVVILHVCFVLLLAAATGVPSYFFQPRGVSVERQNRALALSYYGSAPLALVPLAALAAGRAFVSPTEWSVHVSVVAAVLLLGIVLWAWLICLVRIAGQTLPDVKLQGVRIALGVPSLWIGLAAMTLVALPAVLLYALVIAYSLL